MIFIAIISLLAFVIAIGGAFFSFSSFYISLVIPIFLYSWLIYFGKKTGELDFSDGDWEIIRIIAYSFIAVSISLFYLTSQPESTFLITVFSIIFLLGIAFYLMAVIGPFFEKESRIKIRKSGLLGIDKYTGTLSLQKSIIWGAILGISISIVLSSVIPEWYDPRVIDSIYLQKDFYNKNEFSSEEERFLFEEFDESFTEIEKKRHFERLVQINPKKDFYKTQSMLWTEKAKQAEEERRAKAKQAEEERRAKAKQAEEERVRAARAREERYAEVRRRDGIYSQSQAFSRCKSQLRSKVNRGYYMNYSESTQKSMMTSEIDSCMYKYGYFGN